MPRRVTAATSLAMDIVTYIVTKKVILQKPPREEYSNPFQVIYILFLSDLNKQYMF